jgi:hypothetical protein
MFFGDQNAGFDSEGLNEAADVLCRHLLGTIRLLEYAACWKRLWLMQDILMSEYVVKYRGPHSIKWAHVEPCFDL